MVLFKFIRNSFVFNLFKLTRFSYAKKYLLKDRYVSLDPYKMHVPAKNKKGTLSIWVLKQIKHRKKRFREDLYIWRFGSEKWLGDLNHIQGLYEYLSGLFDDFYCYDYNKKTVLDVGGYIGDSARYFLNKGAQKVIIYEPVEKNLECMKYNLQDCLDKIQIRAKAVGVKDGDVTLCSQNPPGDVGFGFKEGEYRIQVQSESFATILNSTQADVAKIDCEGYEKYLLDVPDHLLRRIPYWIIEIHDAELRKQLYTKFQGANFQKQKTTNAADVQAIDHFKLVSN